MCESCDGTYRYEEMISRALWLNLLGPVDYWRFYWSGLWAD